MNFFIWVWKTLARAGMERLPFKPEGYNFWTWRGRRIHYVEQGSGPPVVLIHGFGASAFHWRWPSLSYLYLWPLILLADLGRSLLLFMELLRRFDSCFVFFRYNVPELAKQYKVYALDLIGFGWSEKAIIEYDATVWRDQVADFLKQVVKEPAVLVGNR